MSAAGRRQTTPAGDEATTPATDPYVPGLDGLRAFAVVAAMLFHAGALRGGFLGVDLFFVVSGFLITRLLLADVAGSGRVRLGRFWARRARRLFPALLLVLVVTLVWAYLAATPSMARTTTSQLGWSLVYLTNWFALFGDVGYWGAAAAKTPLNHLWSLAIEEQFYVVWPLVVAGTLAVVRRRRALAGLAFAGIVVSGSWQWWVVDHWGLERAYLGTDTRAIALLVGCLLAAVRAGTGQPELTAGRDRGVWTGQRGWDAAVVVAAGWLGWSWVAADLAQASLHRGWLQSCSVAAGVLVAAVVSRPAAWYGRALSSAPLVWVGRRSYSLYLWHWPLWVMLSPAVVGRSAIALWTVRIAATVVVSTASYAWVEQPIRTGRVAWPRLATAGGAVVAGLAVAVLAFPPALPPEQRDEAVTLGAARDGPGLDILVVGDSWARNLGFALALADSDKRDTVINLGLGGCGLVAGTDRECVGRQQAGWTDVLASRRPDVAVLVTGTIDAGLAARTAGTAQPCERAWDDTYAAELDRALGILRGPDRIPIYVTTVLDGTLGRARAACVNRLLVDAARRNGARILDMNGQLCPQGRCVTEHEGRPVYDDTRHLGPAGQRWIGGWVLDILRHDVSPVEPTPATARGGPCTSATGAGTEVAVASYASRPDGAYPDTPSAPELTDGRHGKPRIDDPAWQGWTTPAADIVVTLRGTEPVCSVETSWLQVLGAAVQPPPLVEVYVAADPGQPGTRLGAATTGQLSAADQSVKVRVAAGAPVSGRFVTIRARAMAQWTFVDEVTVLGLPR